MDIFNFDLIEANIFNEADDDELDDWYIYEYVQVGMPRQVFQRNNWFDILDDISFRKRFRLSRDCALYVLRQIEHHLEYPYDSNNCVSPMNQFLTCLRFYSTGGHLQLVGDYMNMHVSTVCRIIRRVSEAIAELYPVYIRMPANDEDIQITQQKFFDIAGFPRVIGDRLYSYQNSITRLLPNIFALIMFCTYILPYVNSGPLWPMVVEHHAALCKQHMWRNLLFVHNYFGFENMCLTHTHQVGIDMQLFVLTYVLYLLTLNKKWTFFISGTVWILSTVLRYVATIRHNLSHMIYFGTPIHQMFDTANLSYILPTHRATIYITGIFLAYALKQKVEMNKVSVRISWFVSVLSGLLAVIGPFHMSARGYVYNNKDAALFAAISPILWGICMFWTVIASNNGYAGWFGNFLSWRGFKYFTKIAYSFYLVQFPVFFYNVGIQRTPSRYSLLELLHFPETSVILALSIVLTVCVELPFQRLEKVLFKTKSSIKLKE